MPPRRGLWAGESRRQAGVAHFVFPSRLVSVYGFQGETLITEDGPPNSP